MRFGVCASVGSLRHGISCNVADRHKYGRTRGLEGSESAERYPQRTLCLAVCSLGELPAQGDSAGRRPYYDRDGPAPSRSGSDRTRTRKQTDAPRSSYQRTRTHRSRGEQLQSIPSIRPHRDGPFPRSASCLLLSPPFVQPLESILQYRLGLFDLDRTALCPRYLRSLRGVEAEQIRSTLLYLEDSVDGSEVRR